MDKTKVDRQTLDGQTIGRRGYAAGCLAMMSKKTRRSKQREE